MRTLLLIAIGSGLLMTACAGPSMAQVSGGQTPQVTESVSMAAMKFAPGQLTVKAGTPVHLALSNQDTVDHDFTVMGMPVKDVKNTSGPHAGMVMGGMVIGHAQAGQAVSIEFTPTQKGTYEFYCAEPGHKDAGMKGTLTVE